MRSGTSSAWLAGTGVNIVLSCHGTIWAWLLKHVPATRLHTQQASCAYKQAGLAGQQSAGSKDCMAGQGAMPGVAQSCPENGGAAGSAAGGLQG